MAFGYDPHAEDRARAVAPIIFDRRGEADVPTLWRSLADQGSRGIAAPDLRLAPRIGLDIERQDPFLRQAVFGADDERRLGARSGMSAKTRRRAIDAPVADVGAQRELVKDVDSSAQQPSERDPSQQQELPVKSLRRIEEPAAAMELDSGTENGADESTVEIASKTAHSAAPQQPVRRHGTAKPIV